jgi:hypothetical protein
MVAPASAQGDVMELTRAQETELPQALKWQVARADEDYDAAQVEARRITVDTTRIASESFPMAIPPEEAERRCRRALMEAWVGRESAVFRLPPSRLALDPCDVILLDHDGRLTEMRLVSIADSDLRSVDAVRQDRAVYDLPPGEPRPASCRRRRSLAHPTSCSWTCRSCARISLRIGPWSRRMPSHGPARSPSTAAPRRMALPC